MHWSAGGCGTWLVALLKRCPSVLHAGTNFAYVYEDPFRTQDEGFLRSGYYYPTLPVRRRLRK